jgi:multidrug efflux system membrane fusion protein
MSKAKTIRTFLFISACAMALIACGGKEIKQTAAPSAPKVDVASVIYQRITEWDQFTGRLQAPEKVALIPRVSGYIETVNFK